MNAFRRWMRPAASAVAPAGWAVIALALSTLFATMRLGWDELEIVALGSLVLLMLCATFAVGRLDIDAEISVRPARVVVGSRAAGALRVRNRRSRAARSVRLELPVGDAVAVYPLSKLDRGESTEELFVVPTHRRAVLQVGPVTSVQGDPLGLFRRTRRWASPEEIFVHPRTVRLSAFASGLIRDMEGQATNEISPSDIAFHALRDYVPGDDRRHIHWKSTAKTGDLMVRQYVDTRRSHVAVALSTDPSDYADDDEFELAVSCAASVASQSLSDGQTLSMYAGETQLPTMSRSGLMDRFAAVEPSRRGNLGAALHGLRTNASEASVAVVCVGSILGAEELRKSMAWLPSSMPAIVLRASPEASRGYRVIGSITEVTVPQLEQLGVAAKAVIK